MKLKLITAALFAVGLTSGAFAQTDQGDQLSMMKKFFKDAEMTQMMSPEEMTAAYGAMSTEEKAAVKTACDTNNSPRFQDVCAQIIKM